MFTILRKIDILVKFLYGILFCTMTMHGHCLHEESVISESIYVFVTEFSVKCCLVSFLKVL